MNEKGPYRELPVDEARVTAAFNHIVNFAAGYRMNFQSPKLLEFPWSEM